MDPGLRQDDAAPWPGGYACDYVGQVPAAKSYGTMRMYHLRLVARAMAR
jgi:hypothetical protein